MDVVVTVVSTALTVYALVGAVYLISENRRPQATLAWMLILFFVPVLGLLIYVLFGRDRKAFSRQSKLARQVLEPHARPLLAAMLSRQDAEINRLQGDSVARRKLMNLIRRNSLSALTTRNRVEVLQNASVFYPRLLEDVKAARRSVHLQYFIWRGDEGTEPLKQALCERARAGVEVRLLYDPLGSHAGLRRAYVREMREAGVQMVPASPWWHLHTISYRNHRKITVIDGAVGYTGGMNIGREHLTGGKGFDFWRDTQLRVAGEAAAALQAVFAVDWYNTTGEDLFSPAHFPPEATDPPGGDVPVQIVTSGPDSKWAAIGQLYALMVASARQHVYVQSPYFVPNGSLAEALKTAALAGVDVRVMLSARASGDQLANWAGNTFIAEVAAAGVRVFLYEKGYLHAKTVSIDSEICSIGSANIDIRSFSINYELNAVIYSEEVARGLEADFERDLADCTEFDLTAYRNRNRLSLFRDSLARLLSPLL